MIVFVLLLPAVLGAYEPAVVVPGPFRIASDGCPEGHAWLMGRCYCYDGEANCAELIEKYTCEPWTRERYLRERLPMNVREACGYSCGICDAWKTPNEPAPSASPGTLGTTKGEATSGAGNYERKVRDTVVVSTWQDCPEDYALVGNCACHDSDANCAKLSESYYCEPWSREPYMREKLTGELREACTRGGSSCNICDLRKTATDSVPSPSPSPVGTTNGDATTDVGPSTPSGPDNGSAEVHVSTGTGTPEKECKDVAPGWACKGLKKVYACKAPKFIKYPAEKCAKTCGLCQ